MLIVTGAITAHAGTFDQLLELALAHVHRSRTEPGCTSHGVHRDTENPLRLVFFEEWESREALLAHFAVPASREFVKHARELAAEMSAIGIFEASKIDL